MVGKIRVARQCFFIRLRGLLAIPFFGKCGKKLGIGPNVTFYNPSKMEIGDWVYMAYGCWFSGGAGIKIGNEVLFGPYCVIASTNHTVKDGSYRFGKPEGKPVYIGKGSWIAAHSVVLTGVELGEGVVAANSVVNKSFPKKAVIGGTPAKVIK